MQQARLNLFFSPMRLGGITHLALSDGLLSLRTHNRPLPDHEEICALMSLRFNNLVSSPALAATVTEVLCPPASF